MPDNYSTKRRCFRTNISKKDISKDILGKIKVGEISTVYRLLWIIRCYRRLTLQSTTLWRRYFGRILYIISIGNYSSSNSMNGTLWTLCSINYYLWIVWRCSVLCRKLCQSFGSISLSYETLCFVKVNGE